MGWVQPCWALAEPYGTVKLDGAGESGWSIALVLGVQGESSCIKLGESLDDAVGAGGGQRWREAKRG